MFIRGVYYNEEHHGVNPWFPIMPYLERKKESL